MIFEGYNETQQKGIVMRKYLQPALAVLIGLVLLGPVGGLLSLLTWAVVKLVQNEQTPSS